jgi:nitrogen fixation NifU-like protein
MQQPELSSLYQQLILEHYRHPRNKDELPDRTAEAHLHNPVCGDEVCLQIRVADGRIEAARFTGHGCSISQASVSMMTTLLEGRSLEEADALVTRFTEMMRGEEGAGNDRSLGDLRALRGVAKFPVRIKCALLGFDALREVLAESGLPSAEEGRPRQEGASS